MTDGGQRGDLKYRSAARHRAARLAAFCRWQTSSAHVASALAPNFRTNTSGGRHGGFVPIPDLVSSMDSRLAGLLVQAALIKFL